MTRRRLEIAAVMVLCVAVALAGFYFLVDVARDLEIRAVTGLLALMGERRASVVDRHYLQILPFRGLAFRAYVTPFCSALVSVLALGCIAMFVLRGPLWRRAASFATAAAAVFAGNVVRITLSVYAGLRFGASSLVLFHDWAGTIFGLLYTMYGFFLMLWLLLPSAKSDKLVRAARVSDVL